MRNWIVAAWILLVLLPAVSTAKSMAGEIVLGNFSDYRPKIAIVLGGGGARGIAQVGVLQVLEREKIKIDYLVGTSIGAIVGGLYASGYSAGQLDSIVCSMGWSEMFAMADGQSRDEFFLDQKQIRDRYFLSLRFNRGNFVVPEGISTGIRYTNFLQTLLWTAPYRVSDSFDDLKYKFRAVATDLISGETVSFGAGNIVTAIKASSTFPLKYSPVRYDGKILIDGGILANVPTVQAQEFSPDIMIAVKSASPLHNPEELDKPWIVADQVIGLTMKKFEDQAEKLADFLIIPEVKGHENSDFSDFRFLIDAGRQAAENYVAAIKTRMKAFCDSVLNARTSPLFVEMSKYSTAKFSSVGMTFRDSLAIYRLNLNYRQEDFLNVLHDLDHYNNVRINYSLADDAINIKLLGEQMSTVRYVRLQSMYPKITDEIEQKVNYRVGSFLYERAGVQKCTETVLQFLNAGGYNLSSIDTSQTRFLNDTLWVPVHIPQIRNIVINGNCSVSDELILRDMDVEKNEFVHADLLSNSWENINNTGWFSNVDMKVAIDSTQDFADVIIGLNETGTQEVNFGLRIDDARKTRVGVDLIEENLFNFGTRFNLRFVGGERDIAADLIIEQPRFMDTYFTFRADAYYKYKRMRQYEYNVNFPKGDFNHKETPALGLQAYGAKITVGRQLNRDGRIGLEARFEQQRSYKWDIPSKSKPNFKNVATAKFEMIFDTENDTDYPTAGRQIALSFETNILPTELREDNVSYSKALFNFRGSHTFAGRHTLRLGATFGFSDNGTPISDFFNLGGQEDFFGLQEEQQVGRQIVRGQLEYRLLLPFRIFFDTYWSLRYDIGAVWDEQNDIHFDEFKHGVGTTIGFDTPLGPAKFSIGRCFFFARDPVKVIYGPLVLYFSVGIKL